MGLSPRAATDAATDAATQTVVYAAPAPVVEYMSPASAVYAAPAPVNEYEAPALVFTNLACLQEPPLPVVQVVQVPQVQMIEKIAETPEILSGQDAQTSETLGIAPAQHVNFAETVDVARLGPPLPAESGPPLCVTTPVVEALVVMVEHVQPAPVVEFVAPSAPTPMAENVAPAPAVIFSAQAPVDDCIAPAPAVVYTAQAPADDFRHTVEQIVGAPVPQFVEEVVPDVSYAASTSSSRETVAERMRLWREAQEASADRPVAELLAEEAAANPDAKKAKNGKHKK